jgi:hypothetical protein
MIAFFFKNPTRNFMVFLFDDEKAEKYEIFCFKELRNKIRVQKYCIISLIYFQIAFKTKIQQKLDAQSLFELVFENGDDDGDDQLLRKELNVDFA